MITTQALLVILGWLGTRDLLGVSALPGPSTGNVSGVPRFHRTLRSVTSNTNATSPIDTGSYDVSIPVGLRILELFQYEVPKNRDDHEEGSYLGTVVWYADDPAHFASNHSAAPKEACSPEPGPARCSTRYDYPASADLCGVLIDDIIGDMYRGSPYFANKINCSDHNKAPASSVPSVTPASTLNKTGAVTKMSTIATSTPTSHPHPPFHGNRKVSFFPYSPRSVCLSVASTQKQCCVSWADNLRQGRKNGASIVEALPGYFFRNGKQVLDKCVVGEHVYGKVQDTRVGLDCTTQCISGSVKSGCWRDE